ncbi:MAG: cell division protein FtsL [Treponemataceae bacterium]
MKKFLSLLMTLGITVLLLATVLQSSRYTRLQNELQDYREKEEELITSNLKKISAIAILASPARIEKIAVEDLEMRKAKASEIIRVSLGVE